MWTWLQVSVWVRVLSTFPLDQQALSRVPMEDDSSQTTCAHLLTFHWPNKSYSEARSQWGREIYSVSKGSGGRGVNIYCV